jgi:hypothetical protein
MAYYKITNLTSNFPKRDVNKDRVIDINLANGFTKQNYKLSVNDVLYVQFNKIPVDLHKKRMQGFISITEISQNEFLIHVNKKKSPNKIKPEVISKLKTEKDTKVIVKNKPTPKKRRTYTKKY